MCNDTDRPIAMISIDPSRQNRPVAYMSAMRGRPDTNETALNEAIDLGRYQLRQVRPDDRDP